MMKIAVRVLLMIAFLVVPVFISAGRWDLPYVWAYLAVLIGGMALILLSADRGLLRERAKPGAGGTDRHLRFWVMPFYMGHLIVAGLDVGRYHWSDQVPPAVQAIALVALALSLALSGWAMRVNRFFSPVVRIQGERGHHVVTTGPYGRVRHPGYVGSLVMTLVSGPALGSWWSAVVLLPLVPLILRRVIIEDRYLHEHLAGYPAYASRVRNRLIPGVW